MKVTDYIVTFLKSKGVNDIFGYPGGVVCHLMDSISKVETVEAHLNYNEQGAALAACGYAQSIKDLGVAYATSGPGATNLVTGIANAYFDSIPTLFFTGQVDTYASVDEYPIRQRGFQETNVVSMVKDITKWAIRVEKPEQIRYCLEKAYYIAKEGNPGPVVLDIPADVQRADVDVEKIEGYVNTEIINEYKNEIKVIKELLDKAERPVVLVGNGVKIANQVVTLRKLVEYIDIPVVTTLPAFDVLPTDHPNNYGFIGTNGHRYANFVIGKSDLIISFGSRLDIRQIGLAREKFNPDAVLVRIDIDEKQLQYRVNDKEYDIVADLGVIMPALLEQLNPCKCFKWLEVCNEIKWRLNGCDSKSYHELISKLSEKLPDDARMTIDVGQHQLWVAQAFQIKQNQEMYMSAGHGTMGYAIPAAIGAFHATNKDIYAICGDGGFMMNIQELQYIKKEKPSIKVICINNYSLGMIRGFQERNFNANYLHTTEKTGYLAPNLKAIAAAFEMQYVGISKIEELTSLDISEKIPMLIEIKINEETVLEPNFGANGVIYDQIPYIDRELLKKLESL